jgi:hypothetical protein
MIQAGEKSPALLYLDMEENVKGGKTVCKLKIKLN